MLRTHGITRDTASFKNTLEDAYGIPTPSAESYPGWYMEMQELGFNYRLTDFQAALGLSQLSRAEEGVRRRREIANTYRGAFKGMKGIIDRNREADLPDTNGHAHHLYVIEVENRAAVHQSLRDHGIYSQIHYIPAHLMPYYRAQGWRYGDMPQAEEYYRRCISLPMFPTLSDEDLSKVCEVTLKLI